MKISKTIKIITLISLATMITVVIIALPKSNYANAAGSQVINLTTVKYITSAQNLSNQRELRRIRNQCNKDAQILGQLSNDQAILTGRCASMTPIFDIDNPGMLLVIKLETSLIVIGN
ncbi:hypothetical protein ACFL6Y_03775 [Elusimicrobiota bacterium]